MVEENRCVLTLSEIPRPLSDGNPTKALVFLLRLPIRNVKTRDQHGPETR